MHIGARMPQSIDERCSAVTYFSAALVALYIMISGIAPIGRVDVLERLHLANSIGEFDRFRIRALASIAV